MRDQSINTTVVLTHMELDEGTVVDIVLDNLAGGLQEQCLIRREFVENNFLNGRLPTPKNNTMVTSVRLVLHS